jgi:hypothetical protein
VNNYGHVDLHSSIGLQNDNHCNSGNRLVDIVDRKPKTMNKENIMIIVVLIYLLFLWKFSDIQKGWLVFAALLFISVEVRGESFDIITLVLLIGLGKVGIDLFNAGK